MVTEPTITNDPRQYELVRDLYLDLLAGALTGSTLPNRYSAIRGHGWQVKPYSVLRQMLGHFGLELTRRANPYHREHGLDVPLDADTMIGPRRIQDLRYCIEDVIGNDVPGDFIETGVWRGGACIYMRGVLCALGIHDRLVWVADSFEGMPAADTASYPVDALDQIQRWDVVVVSREEVEANFRKYNLLDDQVRFLQGWFKDTLPGPVGTLAILRLDGDLYSSTTDVLSALYDRLSVGGYVIVDDYGLVTCRAAVDDFRAAQGITDPMVRIDPGVGSVRWKKTG